MRIAARPVRLETPKPSKYRNRLSMVDGIRFASQRESFRYLELKTLQAAGEITGLEVQPQFVLWAHSFPLMHRQSEAVPVGKYIADFRYYKPDGEMVIEDVKSIPTRTAVYRLKKRIVEVQYGIVVREIR